MNRTKDDILQELETQAKKIDINARARFCCGLYRVIICGDIFESDSLKWIRKQINEYKN